MNALSMRFALIPLMCAALLTAAPSDAISTLAAGKKLFAHGAYDSAAMLLRPFVKAHGRDTAMLEMVPLLMESLARTGDTASILPLRDIYAKRFPTSPFLSRVHSVAGFSLAQKKSFWDAALAFNAAMRAGAAGEQATAILDNMKVLSGNNLSIDELTGLLDRTDLHREIRTEIGCALLDRLKKSDNTKRATEVRDDLAKSGCTCTPVVEAPPVIAEQSITTGPVATASTPASPQAKPAETRTSSTAVAIGLLAPLSGANADAGTAVARGAELAVALHNKRAGTTVTLTQLDTKGNYLETVRKTHMLIDSLRTPAIIGPVLSVEAAVAAGMILETGRTAMITPTATEEGIASLAPSVFQLNLTLAALARRMARVAVSDSGIKEIAILAPKNAYGRTLADHFRLEAKKLGATIIAEESFTEGGSDAAGAVARLRTTIASKQWAFAVTAKTPIEGYADRASYIATAPLTVRALYIPAEAAEAGLVATALYDAKVSGRLLGCSGWQGSALFTKGKQTVEGALIAGTAAETEGGQARFSAFASLYRDRFGTDPDKVAAPLGYDAANLILEQIVKGARTGPEIARGLSQTRNFQGVAGRVSFDGPDGANSAASLLQVQGGRFVEVLP